MKLIRAILPHLALALALGLIVLAILDGFNPLMAFLTSRPSKIFLLATCLCSIAVSILCMVENRK